MQRLVMFATISILASGLAWAGDTAPMAGAKQLPAFSEADANQNGLISADEAARYPALKEMFTKADADKDGNLSSSEYQKAEKTKPGKSGS